MSAAIDECYVSVDVETSGPIPGIFSLTSIGACLVENDSCGFKCLLKPISQEADPKAMAVTGLSLSFLESNGLDPKDAMRAFADWLKSAVQGRSPVFVGLNAGFDWSFVNYYFHRYLGHNPFGFAPLDIKALFMGVTGATWRDSKSSQMSKVLGSKLIADHKAINDARAQAELFRLIMDRRGHIA